MFSLEHRVCSHTEKGADALSNPVYGIAVAYSVPLLVRITMDVKGGDLLLHLGTVVFWRGVGWEKLQPGSPLTLAYDVYVRVLQ